MYQNACRNTEKLTKSAAGSIVKFITKSDVDNIPMYAGFDDSLLMPFNQCLNQIQHLSDENKQLTELRDFLLPMLMNGQIKIGE